jgi:hypothetical protein
MWHAGTSLIASTPYHADKNSLQSIEYYEAKSESYIHKFISLRSYIKPVYYTFRNVVQTKITFPFNCPVHWDVPPVQQFIDAIVEELYVLCLELWPLCFHGPKILFEFTVCKMFFKRPRQVVVSWRQMRTLWWMMQTLPNKLLQADHCSWK